MGRCSQKKHTMNMPVNGLRSQLYGLRGVLAPSDHFNCTAVLVTAHRLTDMPMSGLAFPVADNKCEVRAGGRLFGGVLAVNSSTDKPFHKYLQLFLLSLLMCAISKDFSKRACHRP